MRDEDKIEARKHFTTPLLFSIHEAKGLEYENIVLYRFISDHRAEFNEITDGVAAQPSRGGCFSFLERRRAEDGVSRARSYLQDIRIRRGGSGGAGLGKQWLRPENHAWAHSKNG